MRAERARGTPWTPRRGLSDGNLGRVDLQPCSTLLTVRGNRVWVSEGTERGEIVLVSYQVRVPRDG